MSTKTPMDAQIATENEVVEFIEEVAGIYFRSVLIRSEGTMIPQHVHSHDHATYVGSGSARLFIDGVQEKDYCAGHAAFVAAGKNHSFIALEPNTRLACIHDAASADSVKVKGI